MEPFEGFDDDNGDPDDGDTTITEDEEAVALRQQTNLAGQWQSCRERRAPGKLTYNTYFDQINLSKVILSAEPACFNEIELRPDRLHWMKAIEEELMSVKKNNTFVLVKKQPEMKVITCRWVFKLKTDNNGQPSRYSSSWMSTRLRYRLSTYLRTSCQNCHYTYRPSSSNTKRLQNLPNGC
ncbi:uncharacterized protein LOC124421093 [Lucilia cuprina]|uniref:uncharacterized protein LOC124421093 n=1 Tax=Lucilia cuprina TaxID=7375 RepID=UPI001F0533F7|nr:uncharacterized protein LOC124421093 [Lucilia cuprina]